MPENVTLYLGAIVILGMGAQWLAWRLQFPSILFLLVFGFVAGPISGFLQPDDLMGNMLLPFVSLAVAVILFEGGLTLNIRELREIGKVVVMLVSIGAIITGVIGASAAYFLLHLDIRISLLLGAILVVTGPTVIGPLLQHIRPRGKVADVLKWEGIVIDPIGAMLAILVFEGILAGELQQAGTQIAISLLKTIVFGTISGFAFAWLLIYLLRRFWIPDFLHETVTLSLVIASYLSADFFQHESGLFATTLMGIVIANQRRISVKHILDFKENLRVLIISVLFIILAARLDIRVFDHISHTSFLFLAVLIFVARPLSVWVSSINMGLDWKEKAFLSWMAPRGIVAAAVSSIFALRLTEVGIPQTEFLVPLTFIVIVGTVTVYGLTANPLARKLGLSEADPQGVLLVGAHPLAIEMALVLMDKGFKVAMIDSNRNNISKANMKHISSCYGNVLSDYVFNEINLEGIGKLLALTSNDEANSLAVLHYNDVFSREELYQLHPGQTAREKRQSFSIQHLHGRFLFSPKSTFTYLNERFYSGAKIKSTKLTEEFDYNDFRNYYGDDAVPLFCITEENKLIIVTTDQDIEFKSGQTIIALVDDKNDPQKNTPS